jgi:hypothetical protein
MTSPRLTQSHLQLSGIFKTIWFMASILAVSKASGSISGVRIFISEAATSAGKAAQRIISAKEIESEDP